jgi:hypothetical protein
MNLATAALSAWILVGCAGGDPLNDDPGAAFSDRVHVMPIREPGSRSEAPTESVAPPGAHLTYHGGKVIQNARVFKVLYGSGSYLPQITATTGVNLGTAYGQMLGSGVFDWLSEYNTSSPAQTIGRGTFVSSTQIAPAAARNGATISDASIQAELAAQIAAGVLPPPTDNNLYMVNFPAGKSITLGSSSSCVPGGFCAYHGTFKIGAQNVYYGVLPDLTASGCATGCGGAPTTFQNQTSVASHETIEAITDAEVGLATTIGPPLAWYDSVNGEIGDICNAQQGSFVGTDGATYTIQQEFSNQQNDCIITRAVGGPSVDFNIAFQANTTSLWVVGPGGSGDQHLGMMAGTSPSIARLAGGGYEVAFQANTGHLWVTGTAGTADTGLGMAAGTSPSITALATGGYQVAFQANTSALWVTGSAGTSNTGLGMAANTSPSITGLVSGGYQVAFQANTSALWVTGSAGTSNTGLGMAANTSPSIARLVTGGYQVAFQANTSALWVTGSAGTANTGLGMAAGTSPSITGLAGSGYQVAFQANTTALWTTGSLGTTNTGLGMAGNTSPSIAARPAGGFDLVFQANTGSLWTAGSTGTGDLRLGMASHTSPSAN